MLVLPPRQGGCPPAAKNARTTKREWQRRRKRECTKTTSTYHVPLPSLDRGTSVVVGGPDACETFPTPQRQSIAAMCATTSRERRRGQRRRAKEEIMWGAEEHNFTHHSQCSRPGATTSVALVLLPDRTGEESYCYVRAATAPPAPVPSRTERREFHWWPPSTSPTEKVERGQEEKWVGGKEEDHETNAAHLFCFPLLTTRCCKAELCHGRTWLEVQRILLVTVDWSKRWILTSPNLNQRQKGNVFSKKDIKRKASKNIFQSDGSRWQSIQQQVSNNLRQISEWRSSAAWRGSRNSVTKRKTYKDRPAPPLSERTYLGKGHSPTKGIMLTSQERRLNSKQEDLWYG